MKEIRLNQLCKTYLEIRKNSMNIKFREYNLIPAEKYFHESQKIQLKEFLKNKNLIEKYIIKLKYGLFRIKPKYFIKFQEVVKKSFKYPEAPLNSRPAGAEVEQPPVKQEKKK